MWKALVAFGGVGALLSTVLAIAYAKLAVCVSETEQEVLKKLPGANCGACGFSGCEGYARALIEQETEVGLCPVGGQELAKELSEMLGVEAKEIEPEVAVLRCCGGNESTYERFDYIGVQNCSAANLIACGPKSCTYGCLGFGDCVEVCKFDAIKLGADGLPIIDEKKCTGCGACVNACPKNLIELVPKAQKVYVACNSSQSVKVKKGACKVSCIGCGLCEKNCPYNAIKVEAGYARINFDLCQNCGICISKCPTHAIIDKLKARPKAMIGGECTGCGKCKEVCPMKAIEGKPEEKHKVLLDKCVGCALCYKVCKPRAITMAFSLGYMKT